MKRVNTLNLLKRAWANLEYKFKQHPVLHEPELSLTKKRFDRNSPIREFGSEPYFQASLFAELDKLKKDYQNLILGVENKNLAGKRPDILGGRGEKGLQEPEFIIELKVTGTDLLEPFSKSEFGFLMDEIQKYSKIDRLTEGKALFFFGCYYESKPEDILSLVNKHGSLVNWLISERGLEINQEFLAQIVEGYAFRGPHNWLLIDNNKFGLENKR